MPNLINFKKKCFIRNFTDHSTSANTHGLYPSIFNTSPKISVVSGISFVLSMIPVTGTHICFLIAATTSPIVISAERPSMVISPPDPSHTTNDCMIVSLIFINIFRIARPSFFYNTLKAFKNINYKNCCSCCCSRYRFCDHFCNSFCSCSFFCDHFCCPCCFCSRCLSCRSCRSCFCHRYCFWYHSHNSACRPCHCGSCPGHFS